MKRLILATVALSLFAAPAAFAGDRAKFRTQGHSGWHEVTPKHHGNWQKAKKRHHWKKGQRLSGWERKQAIRDYRHFGLRKPGRGQQWVRVDNDFLLIAITSGLIAGMMAR